MPDPMSDPQPGLTPLEHHHAAVAAARDPAEEAEAEAVAYGLFCLELALNRDADRDWRNLDPARRSLYLARGRFVVTSARHWREANGG